MVSPVGRLLALGLIRNIRFGKVSSRQRPVNGHGSPCFYAARRWGRNPAPAADKIQHRSAFTLRNTVLTTIAFGHMAFRFVILRCAIRANHMASSGSQCTSSSTTTKPIFTFMHRTARADFRYKPDLRSGYMKSTDSRQTRSGARHRYLPASRRQHIHKMRRKLTSGVKSL